MRTELIIFVACCALLGTFYVKGRIDGAANVEVKILKEIVYKERETRTLTEKVKKHVQSLDDIQLDAELCNAGIVRGNSGCK